MREIEIESVCERERENKQHVRTYVTMRFLRCGVFMCVVLPNPPK